MKLCCLQLSYLKSYCQWKTKFEETSNGETPKMKVIDLRKLWNFVVDKFLIWICLEPKKQNDLHSV
jgi:hypothetical protein